MAEDKLDRGSWWNPLRYINKATGGVAGDIVDAGAAALDAGADLLAAPSEGDYRMDPRLYQRPTDPFEMEQMRKEREMLFGMQAPGIRSPTAIGGYEGHLAGLRQMAASGDVAAQRRIGGRTQDARRGVLSAALGGPRGNERLSRIQGMKSLSDIARQGEEAQLQQQLRSQEMAQRGIGSALSGMGKLELGEARLRSAQSLEDLRRRTGLYGDWRDRMRGLREAGYSSMRAQAADMAARAGATMKAETAYKGKLVQAGAAGLGFMVGGPVAAGAAYKAAE